MDTPETTENRHDPGDKDDFAGLLPIIAFMSVVAIHYIGFWNLMSMWGDSVWWTVDLFVSPFFPSREVRLSSAPMMGDPHLSIMYGLFPLLLANYLFLWLNLAIWNAWDRRMGDGE